MPFFLSVPLVGSFLLLMHPLTKDLQPKSTNFKPNLRLTATSFNFLSLNPDFLWQYLFIQSYHLKPLSNLAIANLLFVKDLVHIMLDSNVPVNNWRLIFHLKLENSVATMKATLPNYPIS